MAYLRQWQDIVNKIFEMIRKNDNILKLVYDSTPESYDIDTPKWEDVLMKNIFPCPKEPLSVDKQKTLINIYMGHSEITYRNPYYHDDLLYIDVDCHLETWMLKNGEIRPYSLVAMIDEMIDNMSIGDMSIQKVISYGVRAVKFSDMFYGYRMTYKLTNNGSMKCE